MPRKPDPQSAARKPARVQGAPKAPKTEVQQRIVIPAINVEILAVKIIGDEPLICHKWSVKAKTMMLAKQMKQAQPKREAKDPKQDFQDSLYAFPGGGFGFPSTAFKASMVNACRFVAGIPMTVARGAFHVVPDDQDKEGNPLVKIQGHPTPREDMVRLETGVADIRYRGEFKVWSCKLRVRYNANVISPEQLVNLLNTAGFAVGVGEWRPSAPQSKSGSFGTFHIEE